MQVTEINSQGLKREYKIIVPAGNFEERLLSRLAEVAKTVNVPGFRPGKVPMKVLRQKYGPSVMGEVLDGVVNDGARKAITDQGLRPAMAPKVEITAFAEGGDLEFTVAVETMPEIKPMDFALVSIEREICTVPDEEIDNTLARIAEQHDGTEAVERAAQSGDILLIDFVGKKDGVEFPGGAAQDYKLKLGSNTFIPGFEDQLIGVKAGETKVLDLTFPENYGAKELAGAAVTFDVTVKQVNQAVPAKLDDELAKMLGAESIDKLRDMLRSQLGRDLTVLARTRLKRRLLDILAENHDFPVPEGLVSHEFEGIWKQLEEAKANNELDPEDVGKSDDELRAEYTTLAERRVRLGLLLAEIGQSNKITVSQDDLHQGLLAEAQRYPGQEQLVLRYYQENPQALDQIRAPIFEDKVIDFILELAKVVDKTVTAAELRAAGDAPVDSEAKAEEKPKKRATKKKSAEE